MIGPLKITFWVCIGALAYNYFGYPVVMFILAALVQAKSDLSFFLRRENRRRRLAAQYQPRVAVILSAFNEEAVIRQRVENLLGSDYPLDQLEILVGLDNPGDSTAEMLAQIRAPQLRVFHFAARRGKLAVLTDLAKSTTAEILVLTDAETMFDENCIANLVRHFSDPLVGVVGGELRVKPRDGNTSVESLYWRYEVILKFLENRLNCVVGAIGAVYAVRRNLFAIKKATFAEDLQIPMEIRLSGHRVAYDPEAVAREPEAPTFSAEFRRRIRLGAADYQSIVGNLHFLNPLAGMPAFSYLSHKVLKWLGPNFLIFVFISSCILAKQPLYFSLLIAQVFFYSLAWYGYRLKQSGRDPAILSVPLYFSAMNLALFLGMLRFFSGRQKMAWEVTPRLDSERIATVRSD